MTRATFAADVRRRLDKLAYPKHEPITSEEIGAFIRWVSVYGSAVQSLDSVMTSAAEKREQFAKARQS